MIIVRYADGFIIGFQHESDARRFLDEMRKRLGEFALSLHPEKTRAEDPTGSHAGKAAGDQGGDATAYAPADPRTREMAEAGRARLLQLPRSDDQRACTGRLPAPCHRPLAAHAAAA